MEWYFISYSLVAFPSKMTETIFHDILPLLTEQEQFDFCMKHLHLSLIDGNLNLHPVCKFIVENVRDEYGSISVSIHSLR